MWALTDVWCCCCRAPTSAGSSPPLPTSSPTMAATSSTPTSTSTSSRIVACSSSASRSPSTTSTWPPVTWRRRSSPIAERFGMTAEVRANDRLVPMAILASRQAHCLADLLVRWSSGELPADVRVVIANHPDHAALCAGFGIPFVHHPVPGRPRRRGSPGAARPRHAGRSRCRAGRDGSLHARAVARRRSPATRSGSSTSTTRSCPRFAGASPYRQAHDRGVKLIGATAHYATDDLDDGPIIDQDTVRVSHRDDVARLTRAGRDIEVAVLARAVRAHLEHRVLVHGRKTIVF